MKTLYMIRHAKSSWEFDVSDDKRPLNNRGFKDAKIIGEHFKNLAKPIDAIVSSPAKRALTTAQIVVQEMGLEVEKIKIDSDLYDFDGRKVLEVIKNSDDSIATLLIFGHNHAFTSLANLFGTAAIDNVPTAGVVGIEFDVEKWKDISVGKNLLTLFPKFIRK